METQLNAAVPARGGTKLYPPFRGSISNCQQGFFSLGTEQEKPKQAQGHSWMMSLNAWVCSCPQWKVHWTLPVKQRLLFLYAQLSCSAQQLSSSPAGASLLQCLSPGNNSARGYSWFNSGQRSALWLLPCFPRSRDTMSRIHGTVTSEEGKLRLGRSQMGSHCWNKAIWHVLGYLSYLSITLLQERSILQVLYDTSQPQANISDTLGCLKQQTMFHFRVPMEPLCTMGLSKYRQQDSSICTDLGTVIHLSNMFPIKWRC